VAWRATCAEHEVKARKRACLRVLARESLAARRVGGCDYWFFFALEGFAWSRAIDCQYVSKQ